jgi:hypothetical protein
MRRYSISFGEWFNRPNEGKPSSLKKFAFVEDGAQEEKQKGESFYLKVYSSGFYQ